MRIVITGGGTGGHVFPALAVVHELLARMPSATVLYIGRKCGLEQRAATSAGIPFQPIAAAGVVGISRFRKVGALFKLAAGFLQAVISIARFRPHVVFGTGGYVSAPVVAAAALLRVPAVIHEQNRYPGLSNRVLGRFVRRVAMTYEDEIDAFPAEKRFLTGMPVRSDIVSRVGTRTAPSRFSLDPSKFTVMVIGGSQGAHSLNVAMTDALGLLDPKRYQVLFMTGKKDLETVQKKVAQGRLVCYVTEFFEDVADAYAAADLIVCRAGASTLAEVSAFGLPSILVPFPHAAAGHQEANARAVSEAGAAKMVLDSDLDGSKLTALIDEIARDSRVLESMRRESIRLAKPHAARAIADALVEIAGG